VSGSASPLILPFSCAQPQAGGNRTDSQRGLQLVSRCACVCVIALQQCKLSVGARRCLHERPSAATWTFWPLLVFPLSSTAVRPGNKKKKKGDRTRPGPINHVLCHHYLVTAARLRSSADLRCSLIFPPHRTRCKSAVASKLVFQLAPPGALLARDGVPELLRKHAIRYTDKVRRQIPSVSIRYRC
jgi:hypothetical protein